MKEEANTINFQLDQSKVDTFVTGGTLGDMYIILCKLFDYHRRTGKLVRLIRYSCTQDLDGAINQLFKLAPYVELEPCRKTNSNNESIDEIVKAAQQYPFINQTYHGKATDVQFSSENETLEGLADPEYIKLEPFPAINLPLYDLGADRFHIGIQLQCGSLGRNFRGFSLEWIVKLSKMIGDLKAVVHILGTGEGYENSELKKLSQIPNIKNWVGQTNFHQWLSLMKSMNVFITLEGFPAFFAMSQKVPTILYDQYFYGIDNSIHPAWAERNVILKIKPNRFIRKVRHWKIKYLKQKNLYSPHNLQFVRDFIHKTLLKEARNG